MPPPPEFATDTAPGAILSIEDLTSLANCRHLHKRSLMAEELVAMLTSAISMIAKETDIEERQTILDGLVKEAAWNRDQRLDRFLDDENHNDHRSDADAVGEPGKVVGKAVSTVYHPFVLPVEDR